MILASYKIASKFYVLEVAMTFLVIRVVFVEIVLENMLYSILQLH